MKAYQLDLFKDNTEIDVIRAELEELEKSHHKVRRRLFAENRRLSHLYMELAGIASIEFKISDHRRISC